MPSIERRIKWATSFFIWSAVVVLVFKAFEFYDFWPKYQSMHPDRTSAETVGAFLRLTAGGTGVFIFVLVNGLLLWRYKSRIAAALFVALGLFAVVFTLFLWPVHGFTPRAVLMTMLFGVYFLIAGWLMVALKTQHASDSTLNDVFR